jgi:hypothetical protein
MGGSTKSTKSQNQSSSSNNGVGFSFAVPQLLSGRVLDAAGALVSEWEYHAISSLLVAL